MRAKWGMTRPTQPIMPEIDTLAAVTRVAAKMTMSRTRRAFTPMVEASSSPMVSTLMRQRKANSAARPIAMGGSAKAMSLHLAPVRLPHEPSR